MLFILFALGTDAGRVLGGISVALEKVAAIGVFFGHFVYDFFVGVAIVLRTLASQVHGDVAATTLAAIVLTSLLAVVSRRVLRMRRA
jgi:hypothetical protein